MRFNGGNPRAILGTNKLTLCDERWNELETIDLGDDQWKIDQDNEPEDTTWIDEYVKRIKERKQ